ncbi:hypothetical protein [Infirmifilum uzonense]|uniref:hypothetical protein n=1 Tax=Infirmifilum uzonense TaxID=1550241 RepID=UPI001CA52D20|nr:hypothetical protein [Infirmifilum uzonense]
MDEVANKLLEVGREFEILCRQRKPECSEDNLRDRFDRILYEEVLSPLGAPRPYYEYTVYAKEGFLVRHYRIDAYYGMVFFRV